MRFILLLGSLLMPFTLNAAERIVERSIPVNPDVRFAIDSHRGDIEIRTGNVDTIELIAYIEHDDRDVVDSVRIDIDSSASFVDVSVKYNSDFSPMRFLFFGYENYESPDIRFSIVVPEQASLQLKGHRSTFDVQAPAGRVEISSHRGSGHVTNVRNDLDIETHRGDFDVEIAELHDVDLNTHRGNIRLDIANAADFTLSGETHRGDLRFTGKDISVNRRDRNSRVKHSEGDGRNFISFDTHRGNIRMNFIE